MTTDNQRPVVLRGQIMPAEHTNDIRMPAGTPFGLGMFGAMKYAAIRRVLEEYENARRAKANAHHAEAAEADALVGREVARHRLRHIDVILDSEEDRIRALRAEGKRLEEEKKDLAELARLRRSLETLEVQERILVAQTRIDARKNASSDSGHPKQDEYAELIASIGRVPGLVAAAREAKAKIVNTGDGTSPADGEIGDVIDAIVQSWVTKQAESKMT